MFNYVFPMGSEVHTAFCMKIYFRQTESQAINNSLLITSLLGMYPSFDIQQRELKIVIHKLDCLIAIIYYNKYLPLKLRYFRF